MKNANFQSSVNFKGSGRIGRFVQVLNLKSNLKLRFAFHFFSACGNEMRGIKSYCELLQRSIDGVYCLLDIEDATLMFLARGIHCGFHTIGEPKGNTYSSSYSEKSVHFSFDVP